MKCRLIAVLSFKVQWMKSRPLWLGGRIPSASTWSSSRSACPEWDAPEDQPLSRVLYLARGARWTPPSSISQVPWNGVNGWTLSNLSSIFGLQNGNVMYILTMKLIHFDISIPLPRWLNPQTLVFLANFECFLSLSCVWHRLCLLQVWHAEAEWNPGLPQSLVPPQHRPTPLPRRPDHQHANR